MKGKLKPSADALRHAKTIVDRLNATRLDESDAMQRRIVLDADETAMLALQLEQMRARAYEAPYKPIQSLLVAPLASDVDGDAETFSWEELDGVGEANFIDDGGLGDDLKTVDVKSSKQTRSIYTAGIALQYTYADLRRAAFAGKPLSTRKLDGARRAFERLVDRVVGVGDARRGITAGIANWAVGTGDSQVRNTAMTSADWTVGTISAAGMLANLNTLVANFYDQSQSAFVPDTLVMPQHLRLRAQQTMFTDGRPESVLQRFLALNTEVKRVLDLNHLRTADGTSTNNARILLCESSPDNFEAVVPTPFTLRPPQEVGLGVRILAIGRIAGFVIYQPLAMHYGTALPIA